MLRIVALAMPALATINVLNGTLNGAGDTRWPWMITMSGYLLVRIPLTYVLTTPTAQGNTVRHETCKRFLTCFGS